MNCRKFPKFPYRGGKFSKVGNYCGNLSLPSGNLLVLDLVTLSSAYESAEQQPKYVPKCQLYSSLTALKR